VSIATVYKCHLPTGFDALDVLSAQVVALSAVGARGLCWEGWVRPSLVVAQTLFVLAACGMATRATTRALPVGTLYT
jgi:hypothetical protein